MSQKRSKSSQLAADTDPVNSPPAGWLLAWQRLRTFRERAALCQETRKAAPALEPPAYQSFSTRADAEVFANVLVAKHQDDVALTITPLRDPPPRAEQLLLDPSWPPGRGRLKP